MHLVLPKKQIRVAEKKSRKALEGLHLRGLFLFHINNFYRGYLYANIKSTQNRLTEKRAFKPRLRSLTQTMWSKNQLERTTTYCLFGKPTD